MVKEDNISVEAFFYLSNDYIFVINNEGVIVKMNPSFKQLTGLKDEQKEQVNFFDLVYFEDVVYMNTILGKILKENYQDKTLECRFIDFQTKKIVWINFSSVFHSNNLLFITAHDITRLKNKQLELSDDKSKLLKLIELVPHPIFLKNQDGKYVLLNDAQAALFNTNKSTFLGKDDSFFIKDLEQLALVKNSDSEVIRNGKKVTLEDQIITHFDGEETVLHTIKVPFQNSFDGEVYILGVSIDLTEIKEVEKELRKTNFELDSFVYKASHDLRAPLCSITGLLNIMEKEEDEDIVNQCIFEAQKSVKRLDNYISDLTNLTRNSRLPVVTQHIDFKMIIYNCFENLKYMENADRIQLQVMVDPDVDVDSDKGRMRIIFMNIISNAIKYQRLDVNSYINIHVFNDKNSVVIHIKDNGIGIRNKYLPKVYDMFFRASEKSFGSGLGLYIVKQIVEKLGAHIDIESTEGEGTQFNILLPNNS